MALANATRALDRHVTFLHHSTSLQRDGSRSATKQKHWILEEFSLSGYKRKERSNSISRKMILIVVFKVFFYRLLLDKTTFMWICGVSALGICRD